MIAYTDADYRDIDLRAYDAKNSSTLDPKKNIDAHVTTKTTKTTYKVIDQHENKVNGFKAYAVAPIKGKKPDYNNVVVSFAGTDGAGSINDVLTDIETIGLGRNKYIEPKVNQNIMKIAKWTSSPALAALSVSFQDKGEAQSVDALKFYDRVAKTVKENGGTVAPNTSGHSLGGSLSTYVAVKRKVSSVAFNGPDAGHMLTAKERKYIETHPMDFTNYRNPFDLVGNITGNGTKGADYVNSPYKGPWLNNIMNYHGIDKWKFDKSGNLLTAKGTLVNEKANREFMSAYHQTRETLSTRLGVLNNYFGSGSGAGGSAVIFLEAVAAYYLKDAIVNHANQGLEAISKIYDEGKTDQAKVWTDAKNAAYRIGRDLSPAECRSALASGQATHETLVTKFTDQIEQKQDTISRVQEDFNSFDTAFTNKIEEKVADDQAWASQFGIS